MVKKLLTWVIRRSKNPSFSFDQNVKMSMVLELVGTRFVAKLRTTKLLLRGRLVRSLFLGRSVTFFALSKIRFGTYVTVGDCVYLSGLGRNGLTLGNRVSIGAFSRIVVSTSFDNLGQGINIGDDVGIGEFAYVGGAGGVVIGSGCIIGQYFSVHPENHGFTDLNREIRVQPVSREGIEIGSNCWIGSKVTILDGSSVGSGSVIAAGAVVRGHFPANVVLAGVPAKIVKYRDRNE